MATSTIVFRWLEMLEKEFDKAFVDLDILLGEIDEDQCEITYEGRRKMTALSSAFAQLSQKAQTIFSNNSKLEAHLVDLRSELCQVRATKIVLEKELQKLLLQLHAAQLEVHAQGNRHEDSEAIKKRLESEMERYRRDAMREATLESEVEVLKSENEEYRRDLLSLQNELFGAKLAARYLDKELAGRIQQIQLLGRDMRGVEHDKLWNQLEAEIHLHRHKTVIRACRKRNCNGHPLTTPPGHDQESLRKRQGVGEIRRVIVEKEPGEGLGISVTGGKEHGVPILISEIRRGLPADRSGLVYVGDAILSVNGIDLRDMKHKEAVDIITQQPNVVNMEVLYVAPDEDSDDDDMGSISQGELEPLSRAEFAPVRTENERLPIGQTAEASGVDSSRMQTGEMQTWDGNSSGITKEDNRAVDVDIPVASEEHLAVREEDDEHLHSHVRASQMVSSPR